MTGGSATDFDPYYLWLGIAPVEQPPSHYRLLGLRDLENNQRAIENAADRLMLHVRTFQAGPNGVAAQKLLNEIASARITLSDPAKKAAYDQQLQALAHRRSPVAAPPAMQRPLPVAAPLPLPVASPAVAAQPSAPMIALNDEASAAAPRSMVRRKAQDGNLVMTLAKAVIGGAGGIAIGLVVVWVAFKSDPFGLFGAEEKQVVVNSVPQQNPPPPVVVQPPVNGNPNTPVTPSVVQQPPENPFTAGEIDNGPTGNNRPTNNSNNSPPPNTNPSSSDPVGSSNPPNPSNNNPNPNPPEPLVNQPPPQNDPPPLVNPAPFSEGNTNGNSSPPPAVQKRPEPPSTDLQKSKLAELKGIYKSEFDSGLKPANRESFVQFLLSTADKLKSDPDAQFVLFREAYDRSVAQKDFPLAAKVIDSMEEGFELDPFRLRVHMLTQASPTMKLPAERTMMARCALELAEAAVQQKRIAEAQKLSNIAESHGRALQDAQLKSKIMEQVSEIDKVAAQWGPVERARKTLIEDPDNADANLVVGKYRCLLEGDWASGLENLARSGETNLAAAAKQDLAASAQGAPPIAVGDDWFELAKSHDDLSGYYARAQHWYRQASATAEGLDRVRIEQRLEQIEAMNLPRPVADSGTAQATLPKFQGMLAGATKFDPVNVYAFINPQLLTGSGVWRLSGGTLSSNYRATFARLQSTYVPPREYQVRLEVRRLSSSNTATDPGFIVGLSSGRAQFAVAVDALTPDGYVTLISVPTLRPGELNPTIKTYTSQKLRSFSRYDPETQSYSSGGADIVCQVRQKEIRVIVNGELVTSYEGDLNKLAVPREWAVPDPKALFIGNHLAGYSITRWMVEPIGDDRGNQSGTPPSGPRNRQNFSGNNQ